MRLATRLALTLTAVFGLALMIYALVALRQSEATLRHVLAGETLLLTKSLRVPLEERLRASRTRGLAEGLERVLAEPETVAALVVDGKGEVLAGRSKVDSACVASLLAGLPEPVEEAGWIRCSEPVRWARLRLPPPAAALLLVQRAPRLEEQVRAARSRLLLLALILITVAGLLATLVLGRVLAVPLGELVRGARSLGQADVEARVHVGAGAAELHELASAFNRIVGMTEATRRSLLLEAEERLVMQQRMHDAETLAVAGRLTGGVLHELGSPLAVINMQADAILAAPEASPALQERAHEIGAEVERITQLVDGLLRMARRHGMEFERLDLREIVRAAMHDVEPYIATAGAQPTLRLAHEAVPVRGNPTLLRHAIFNVLKNSVQALGEHPGERQVWIEVEPEEVYARVVVEDSGPGIPPELLDRIFDPFFTTKGPGKGSGLGLMITRTILEEHGGRLRVEPRIRGGTVVVMAVPLDHPSHPPHP